MNLEKIPQYELVKQETISDIQSEGYILRHKKSGARIMVLQNEDENKVFNIAFRTPPSDSTGVAHILEHSVLCGSRLFPAKDPFVELVKGSLNTFLNAMTYPDKTMYPIASCNDKDFCNLMHVYLDAVFYPNIYMKEEIFCQEGWSYQLESPEEELVYNGVVYNEMKGALSTPEEVLEEVNMNSLFPDNTYGVNSGGDPLFIPDLKYEDFLAFHKKYYHPSNSYIYFYGNMDIEERLQWLDREYLGNFEYDFVDSAIPLQKPFEKVKEVHCKYSISEDDDLENNTYLSYNVVVGTSLDVELANAFAVLEYALLSAPGAVLKQALLDAGIGKDIMSSYESGVLQPFFSIIAKNANSCDAQRFCQLIRSTLEKTIEEGIDKKALLAGINTMEFRAREADYGSYPKGLMYGIDVFDSWLYDDSKPFDYLKLDVYAKLKEKVETGYFEDLIRQYFIENTHASFVILEPERGLTSKIDGQVKEKLDAYRNSLSEEELGELIRRTEKLRSFQETPSTAEELAKIPMLSREDIGKKAAGFQNKEYHFGDVTVLHHDVFTNGIAYMDLLFDISRVAREDIPYLGILKSVLGMVNTDHYTFSDLNHEINSNTGGISVGLSVYPVLVDDNEIKAFAGVRARVLYDKIGFAFHMADEILFHSKLDDDKRLYEIIAKLKSRLSMQLSSAGHSTAACRATSYLSQFSAFNDAIGGIAFYRLVDDLEKNFDEKKQGLKEKLRLLMGELFHKEGLFVSVTSDGEGLERMKEPLGQFINKLPHADSEKKENSLILEKKNEGFMTTGQVQYVARVGNFKRAGFDYTGVLRIVKVLMSYDYLWTNIRVKGGAYGCMSSFGRTGDSYFVSYRDPNLRATNEVYERVPEYLENFDADEHEMTKYIIGTVSDLDTPLTPFMKGQRSLSAYMSGLSPETVQKERDEVLSATPEQIRALAPLVRSILEEQAICVIGNEEKIKADKDLFMNIQRLQ